MYTASCFRKHFCPTSHSTVLQAVSTIRYSEWAKGWTAEQSGFDCSDGQQTFLFFVESTLILGPTEPHTHWVQGCGLFL